MKNSTLSLLRRNLVLVLPVLLGVASCVDNPANETDDVIPSLTGEGEGFKCEFTNPYSQEDECKQYVGPGWTEAGVIEDCAAGQYANRPGTPSRGFCNITERLGTCTVNGDGDFEYTLQLGGTNADFCSTTSRSCVNFLAGDFAVSATCEGEYVQTEPDQGTGFIFQWPTQSCVEPIEGEPAGQSADGEVCTWNLISGCTEEGRSYYDYGSCDIVRTNRPYYPVPGREIAGSDDPRLQDATYLEESAWVKSQVESCACICCHTDEAPEGPAKWATDVGPLWTDTMSDTAISLFAGYVDSSALGAFPPDENNGFNRIDSAIPTTDVARMLGFFQAEFERRGITREFADSIRPIGGPLVEQQAHVPEACEADVYIDAAGVLHWDAERNARYVYVLEDGAANPGIPPNYDLPEGTIWRLDVPHDGEPLAPGSVSYGNVPTGVQQKFPADGASPTPLVSGQRYYLYVLEDIARVVERCLFTAP